MAEKKKRSLGRRILRVVGVLVLLIVAVVGVGAYYLFKVKTVELDDKLVELDGGGGNTLVLLSDDGALVIDTKFGPPSGKLKDEIAKRTGKPVKMVINTHYHFDHTGGNPRFGGAEFVGSTRTREHMQTIDAGRFGPGAEGAKMVPTTLVDTNKQLPFGDEFVDVRYCGRGHTDGDVIVFLHKRSLVHTGDLFVSGLYPIIDARAGGSFREFAATLDCVIATGAKTVVPGHGPITDMAALKKFRDYVAALWKHVEAGVRDGKSVDEITKGFDATPYGLENMPMFSSLAKNVEAAYNEAKGAQK